jgi:hypothetical protein
MKWHGNEEKLTKEVEKKREMHTGIHWKLDLDRENTTLAPRSFPRVICFMTWWFPFSTEGEHGDLLILVPVEVMHISFSLSLGTCNALHLLWQTGGLRTNDIIHGYIFLGIGSMDAGVGYHTVHYPFPRHHGDIFFITLDILTYLTRCLLYTHVFSFICRCI